MRRSEPDQGSGAAVGPRGETVAAPEPARRIPVAEQVEVVSLIGNIACGEDGKPTLHPHIVVAKADGSAHGGHLLEGHVRPTLELVVTKSPAPLQRRHDPQSGLALIRL